jgi:hypothetical protein
MSPKGNLTAKNLSRVIKRMKFTDASLEIVARTGIYLSIIAIADLLYKNEYIFHE